jgi:two-component system, chemotaxis family, sensor kinase CheA
VPDERFFDEFAEDFFAESTEHLETVRGCLLALEDAAEARTLLPASQGAALMRALHTLKGLCGMVGLTDAASVAHGLEEVSRNINLDVRTPTADTLRVLFDATLVLDQCLKAYRSGTSTPSVENTLRQLHFHGQPETASGEAVSDAAIPPSRHNYTFTFAPSSDLAARGIGVELVRTRLQSLGDVVRVTPRVTEAGSIIFEFNVLLQPDRHPLDAWRADGMDWRVEKPMPAPAQAAVEAAVAATSLPSGRLVRVDLSRLDELMLLTGELVMSRARLADDIMRLRQNPTKAAFAAVEDDNVALERQLRDLRSAIMRVRLVPIGEVFERMRFVARDVARERGKQVKVEIAGGTTEIDKIVVERMLEPMLHLVRNAVSHGIEPASERAAAGKDPMGVITLRAQSAGDQIVIDVIDDGAGVDVERIRAVARERGVLRADREDTDLLEILGTLGFSTSENTDLASGRGVGMDVVLKAVQNVGGELRMETKAGQGTCFTIRLPLTLMIVDALLVSVAGQTYAIPQPSLREVLQIATDEIVSLENNEVIRYREGVLPLIRLRSVFAATAAGTQDKCNVLVVGNDKQQMGLVADRILGLREIVVRPVADPLVSVPGIAGAAELSDGRIALILDANGLIQHAHARRLRTA